MTNRLKIGTNRPNLVNVTTHLKFTTKKQKSVTLNVTNPLKIGILQIILAFVKTHLKFITKKLKNVNLKPMQMN